MATLEHSDTIEVSRGLKAAERSEKGRAWWRFFWAAVFWAPAVWNVFQAHQAHLGGVRWVVRLVLAEVLNRGGVSKGQHEAGLIILGTFVAGCLLIIWGRSCLRSAADLRDDRRIVTGDPARSTKLPVAATIAVILGPTGLLITFTKLDPTTQHNIVQVLDRWWIWFVGWL